jgi:hypothetical protein
MTAASGRERLRFLDFEFERLPSGRYRARVVLEGDPGERFVGTAEGLGSQAGELRCAAEAATDALRGAVEEKLAFELLGVKAVRAFDSTVVIVAISCHNGMPATRLVGSCLTDEAPHRCAALAVLNATNRFLGNIIFTR